MRYRIEDVEDLQTDIAALPTKWDRVTHFVEHFGLPANFVAKKVDALLHMDPEQLVKVLMHADPTGETAARNVDRGLVPA